MRFPYRVKAFSHVFRSLLEFQWAAFFEALRIEWFYEKEKIDLGNNEKYIPDFWFLDTRDGGCWLEIKAKLPLEAKKHNAIFEKLIKLTKVTKQASYLAIGPPWSFSLYFFDKENEGKPHQVIPSEERLKHPFFLPPGYLVKNKICRALGISQMIRSDLSLVAGNYFVFNRDFHVRYGALER